jgi:predicted GNAT family N-acyltransferase
MHLDQLLEDLDDQLCDCFVSLLSTEHLLAYVLLFGFRQLQESFEEVPIQHSLAIHLLGGRLELEQSVRTCAVVRPSH